MTQNFFSIFLLERLSTVQCHMHNVWLSWLKAGVASFSDRVLVMPLQWLVVSSRCCGENTMVCAQRLMINMLLQCVNQHLLAHLRAHKEAAEQARALHQASKAHLKDAEQLAGQQKVLLWTKLIDPSINFLLWDFDSAADHLLCWRISLTELFKLC